MMSSRLVYSALVCLLLSACGGGGGGSSSVGGGTGSPPANSAPVLAAVGDQQVFEGTDSVITTLSASDSNGDALTFELAGSDADSFTLSASQQLSFVTAPDFESPADASQINIYELIIRVSDGVASDQETIAITVLDALEGRVVDGPISGGNVIVTGASGSVSETVATDEQGFWLIPETIEGQDLQVRSTGGVDVATGRELSDLVLISDLPADAASPINVNAITTILSVAQTLEQQIEILEKLGLDVSPDELIATDIWDAASSGDSASQLAQRVNSQLNLIILTTQTVISNTVGDQFDAESSVLAVATVIAQAIVESDDSLLASSERVAVVIIDAVSSVAPTIELDAAVVDAISEAVADTNATLSDETVDPTSETSAGVSAAGQGDLQSAVAEISIGQINVETFQQATEPLTLFEGVPGFSDVDSDGDGVSDSFDEYPNDPANFTDTDSDGVYDFYDADPSDASNTKAIRFAFQNVNKAGVSESLSESESLAKAETADWRTQISSLLASIGDFLLASPSIAEDIGPDLTSELDSVTNLIAWGDDGTVLSDIIESNESMFVAEAVLHPNGGYIYVVTSPAIQRALNDAGRLELQVDSCQLYKVVLDEGGGFICLLDETDPEIRTVLRSSVWRDDFLRAGISFRSDGVAVLESSQGPMLLQEDGTYQIFNEISREAPEGYVKNTETIVWLDDNHIGIATNVFPEGGGGTTTYWTAFNVDTGEEVAEIEGTDFRIVAHDGSLYTSDGRVAWTGDGFQSDGQGYAAVQDVDGNLWDKGNVYGLTLIDEARGLQLSLGEEGTEGPNIYLRSGTGTGITYRDYAFDGDWVLSKYSRHAADTIISVLGVPYEPNEKLFIDLGAPNGAFIKLYDPDLWYYLRSGNETEDVAISYEVETADGQNVTRQFVFPMEAIESFAAFDPTVYDATPYANGYEILEQNGEGIALEGPNPEPEESTFCLFNSISQQQRCADLSGYSVLRTDLENIRNNTERHFPPSDYACPDNSCQAMPGVQNIVFGGAGLLAFFKDSADNQYYKASADLEEFMLYGDDALTITSVLNGAGESEIVASTTSLVPGIQREVDVSRLSPFEYDFDTNKITINFGASLATRIQPPMISVTLDTTQEAVAVISGNFTDNERTTIEYLLADSALTLSGSATVALIADPHPSPMFFVKDSPLRHGWDDTRTITLGDPDADTLLDGGAGDDAITIDGAGNKTVDGGPGTDSLTINYGSISSLADLTIGISGDYTSLADSDGNVILYKNIETLVVGDRSYTNVYGGLATDGTSFNTSGIYYDPAVGSSGSAFTPDSPLTNLNFGNDIISSAYFDATNNEVYLYSYGDGNGSHLTVSSLSALGYDDSDLTIYGTALNDLIAGGSSSAGLTVSAGAGFDVIDISNGSGSDTVDAGAGNDIVYVNYANYGSDTSIDGGAGTDTLFFTSTSSSITYTLNSSPTSNFESVYGSSGDDALTGDGGNNRLVGYAGSDTLSGGVGDDELYGHFPSVVSPTLYEGEIDGGDTLYGGEGDDSLYGGAGDDTLDGGIGRDVLTGEGPATSNGSTGQALLGGPAGSDTFVTRAGDGSTVLAQADVITDFEDGTDQIGLDGINFNDLTIAQGTDDYVNDTVVSITTGGEYLFVIQNTTASNITYLDMVSTSTDPLSLSGTSNDDVLLGGSGSDTITSGTGTDVLIGYSGDDAITIDGAGNKTVDGGPGTDSLTINYGSISSLADLTIGISGDYTSLTDSDGNVILYKNIETLVVGDRSYTNVYGGLATDGTSFNTSGIYYDPAVGSSGSAFTPDSPLTNLNFGNDIISSAYFDATNNEVYLYSYGDGNGSHLTVSSLSALGYDDSDLTIYGTALNDLIAGGSSSAGLTVSAGAGFDVIDISNGSGSDTVDAGAGNDIVYVNYANYGSDTSIDGGAGTDTLFFTSTSSSITYTLNSSPTSNFESVYGSSGDDALTGDGGNNRLVGYAGSDTLSGGVGDDELYGHFPSVVSPTLYEGEIDGGDTLYGGEGDDSLYGGAGDDTLDGGIGRDVLTGEGPATSNGSTGQALLGGPAGSDTFVTRAGDGSTVLAQADVITDFEDGTDQIGLDGINFNDLTIAQGTDDYVNDTVVSITTGGEYLFVIQNTTASNITYLDMVSTSTDPLSLSGTSNDDVLLGGSGSDTITSGTGTDVLIGYSGDDAITIDGAGNKTVDGGPGTDSLTINYGSISSLADLTIGISGDYTSLTDSDGNVILYKNIETLVVGDRSYTNVYGGLATDGTSFNTSGIYYDPAVGSSGSAFTPDSPLTNLNFGNDIISSAYFDATNNEVYLYSYGDGNGSHLTVSSLSALGYDDSDLTIYGTALNDLIAGGSSSAGLTVSAGAGFDVIDISNGSGSDTVDAGAGNDIVYVNYANYGSDTSIDGGAGTDTLFFTSTSSSITYTLNSSPTSNFESVYGSSGDDALTGDGGNNRLVGYAGSDTLSGGVGDDELYGHFPSVVSPTLYEGEIDGGDTLYGGEGDDSLYGGAGDDTLDGGIGRDVLTGEGPATSNGSTGQALLGGPAGSDTFVTRAGDGSTVLAQADVITDFEDGTDQIGLDGINFNDLTIAQGTDDYVNDTVVSITTGGEYLFVIQNTTASNITYLDMVSTSTDPLSLSGTSNDDVLLGGSGSDTITSGTGTDVLIGYSGDDAITIDGAGNKTVDGGPGTDSLTINYGSISSLADLTIGISGDYTSLTDSDGNVILYKNIETLVVGDRSYTP